MSLFNYLLYGDRILYSLDEVKACLKIWGNDLPLNLSEDTRTNAIAVNILDREVKITVGRGKQNFKKKQDLEESRIELEGIDSIGREVKWLFVDSFKQNPYCLKKELFIFFANRPNDFYAHYICEVK